MTKKSNQEPKVKKTYTQEFKLEAVKLVVEEGMTGTQVAKDLGLNYSVLSRWVSKYRVDKEGAFPGKGRLTPEDQRVRDLEKQVRRLTMERDILKKAMAYFAKLPE
jgi:transposase